LLDFPAPVLRAYPKETVVAEKLEALTALGLLNSRMKDFYDLALLSRMYPFEGERLAEAIVATFHHRGTTIEAEPIGLTRAYCDDPTRAVQWGAFVRRSRFGDEAGDLARFAGSQAVLGNERWPVRQNFAIIFSPTLAKWRSTCRAAPLRLVESPRYVQ